MSQYWFMGKRAVYTYAGVFDKNGHTPSLVVEGEPGHRPMTGDPSQLPWYWGKTPEECQARCDAVNKDNGFSEEEVLKIIGSSMRA
jgi:hypothetical protein